MRSHSSPRVVTGRTESAFVSPDSRASEPRSTYLLNPSTRPGQYRSFSRRAQMPATSRNGTAEIRADIDGISVLFRIAVKDAAAEMQSDFVSSDSDLQSLLSRTLEKMADRMRGSSSRSDNPSKQPRAILELVSSGAPSAELPAPANATALRVGPLELDLIDRTAKRGGRQIDLRPREFQLLKYMMQRSDKLLTRAALFKDVWHYKFVPDTNLVDVHMGRLRRKIDAANEAPLIRNIRGAGFVLSATPLLPDSADRSAEPSANMATGDKSPEALEGMLQ
jgi:DNA-binding winged helix-turn-helix (wHTH) protein